MDIDAQALGRWPDLGAAVQEALRRRLRAVRWLGGSPCSGKSSVAELLVDRYAVRVYHVDVAFEAHRDCLTATQHPLLTKWTTTPWDALWTQPRDRLLDEALACYTEQFSLILEDLLLAENGLLLAEGTSLLPPLVQALLTTPDQGLWLAATETFQRARYSQRDAWVAEILAACADSNVAFENWMSRDVAFSRWVVGQTNKLSLPLIEVDGTYDVLALTELVGRCLGFHDIGSSDAPGPVPPQLGGGV